MEVPTPIAVVGMACRFCGDVDSPERLWRMCAEARSGWSRIPPSRFNLEGVYHQYNDKAGTLNVVGGHFLTEDPAVFDGNFFNLSQEAAASMDPQYRMQLETTYETFESAGLTLQDVAGSNTSVFAGAFFRDYADGLMRDPDVLPRLYLLGVGGAMAANRLSHFYDLRGPSMTVDTGCSTSLTALHQACQSLRARESDMSIIGGANVMLNPDMFAVMSSLTLLSEDGKSFAFDSRANGYGRGEGSATVIIKRLDDAVRDGNPIRAVIRESMINQDGRTETITSPSLSAQRELIRGCYRKAGLDPAQTTYFETHGTGTPTGDPIEANAIASTFRTGRHDLDPLLLGSVKTNIGHTETASGLASVIKVTLALEKGQIPPNVNFEKANPKLDLEAMNLKVPTELQPWPGIDGIRRASVNSFGYGGANAHVIMEDYQSFLVSSGRVSPGEYPSKTPRVPSHVPVKLLPNGFQQGDQKGYHVVHLNGDSPSYNHRSRVVSLSAKDERAAKMMVENLKRYLTTRGEKNEGRVLDDLAYTLGQGRTRFPWVASLAVESVSGLVSALDTQARPSKTSGVSRLGFVFTGQGAQWWGMGRELIHSYPVFRNSLTESARTLRALGSSWDLIDELTRDEASSRVNESALSMPSCVAVQIALVDLLQSWGIACAAVASHSSGEIAAAYAAGAISKDEAIGIAYSRGQFAMSGGGSMTAVALGPADAQEYIARVASGRLVVACMNSPTSTTVSGDVPALEELESFLQADGIFSRRLRVDTAYHSFHMEKFKKPYEEWIANHIASQPKVTNDADERLGVVFSSPITGGRVLSRSAVRDPGHWAKGMVSPVRFVEAFQHMCLADPHSPTQGETEVDMVIEIGPHGALGGPIQEILHLPEFKDYEIPYGTCLVRRSNAVHTMHKLICKLLDHGYPVDLEAVNFPLGRHGVRVLHDLPHYPWNHQTRYWCEPRYNRALRQRAHGFHDLLGYLIPGTNSNCPSWRNMINEAYLPWVRDHAVQTNIVYPGAGLITMAVEAILQSCNTSSTRKISGYMLRDVNILQALVIPARPGGVEVQLELRPRTDGTSYTSGWKRFTIHSIDEDSSWTAVCKGLICVHFADEQTRWSGSNTGAVAAPLVPPLAPERYRVRLSPQHLYANLRAAGIIHGPSFQNLRSIRAGRNRSISTFTIADTAATMPHQHQHQHVIHPTTLDTVIQSAYTALKLSRPPMREGMIPKSIKSLWISHDISTQPCALLSSYAYSLRESKQSAEVNVSIYEGTGENLKDTKPVVEVGGLTLQSVGATPTKPGTGYEIEKYSEPRWVPDFTFMSTALLKTELACPTPENELEVALDLSKACHFFIRDALSDLGPDIADEAPAHYKKYYAWMEAQVELTEKDARNGRSVNGDHDSRDRKNAIIDKASKESVVGEMVCQLGPSIPALLRGKTTPLELMLQNDLLERYYAHSPKLRRSYRQMSRLVGHFINKNPRAKILEIGGGTGAATMAILSSLGADGSGLGLAAAVSYDFTDVSPGFFEAARAKFGIWGNIMRYRKLDITQDPAVQWFEPGTYDLVIASQVLHATKSMKDTMSNVRRLLKTGGMLFMLETTHDQVDLHFTFGLLPEWWVGEEEERRTTPSLSVDAWDSVLRDTGFGGVDIDIHDCLDESLYSFSVLSSTAIESPEQDPVEAEVVLVLRDTVSAPPTQWMEAVRSAVLRITGSLPSTQTLQSIEATAISKPCIYLGDLYTAALRDPDEATFEGIKSMCTGAPSVLWLTRGGTFQCERADSALATGFLRSARVEFAGKLLASLDLDPAREAWSMEDIPPLETIVQRFLSPSSSKTYEDFEYAERDGTIHVLRYVASTKSDEPVVPKSSNSPLTVNGSSSQPQRSFRAYVETAGLLNTLSFKEDPETHADLPPDHVEIEPKAFGVNFRDVMVAMGQLPSETAMGFECAGIVTRAGTEAADHGFKPGDRVAALLKGNYASSVRTLWTSAVKIPEDLAFDVAASIPMVFATAYLSLFDAGRLEKGERVLIHAATGGVGQAAVMLAKNAGAEIFATVSTMEKRDLLMERYGIASDHIFSSRDASFSGAVLSATQGQGVDLVINSLSGTLLQEGFNCLARFGRFVEIGKRDIEVNSDLEMSGFGRSATFIHLDLMQLQQYKGVKLQRVLTEIMRMFSHGQIEPVTPVTVYPLSELEKMLRLMQAGKHIGKIVAKVKPGDIIPIPAQQHSFTLRSNGSYLIVGGLGGIGRSICQWLAEHGAKSLIILSRTAQTTESSASLVADLAELDCQVHFIACDISVRYELFKALEYCRGFLPPIRGVVHAGMVLRDSILERMSVAQYGAALKPKVEGSWHLHELLGDNELDFFIMLSSLTGIFGSSSQSNYAAGGTFQDALAFHRTSRGLPGVSINLSVVSSVGYAAEHDGVAERLSNIGYRVLSEEDVLEAVGRAISSPFCGQFLVGVDRRPGPHWQETSMGRDRRFAPLQLHELEQTEAGSAIADVAPSNVGAEIARSSSFEEAQNIVVQAICKKVRDIFLLEDEINVKVPLTHYGVDSLVVIEIRNMLALVAGIEMSVFDIIQSPSISSLGSSAAAKSSHLDPRLLQP